MGPELAVVELEAVVTPEMIEAGMAAYAANWRLCCDDSELEPAMLCEVFQAMQLAQVSPK